MSEIVAFLVLAQSLAMPPLTSWLKSNAWSQQGKVLLTLLLCLIGGVATALIDGSMTLTSIAGASTAIFTGATAFYKLYFEQTQANWQLEQKDVL